MSQSRRSQTRLRLPQPSASSARARSSPTRHAHISCVATQDYAVFQGIQSDATHCVNRRCVLAHGSISGKSWHLNKKKKVNNRIMDTHIKHLHTRKHTLCVGTPYAHPMDSRPQELNVAGKTWACVEIAPFWMGWLHAETGVKLALPSLRLGVICVRMIV